MKGERGRNGEQEQAELEDTFGGKINVGEEYVGQQQIPVPRTPSKGGDPVHYLSVLVEKSEIKPNSNTLPYFYRIREIKSFVTHITENPPGHLVHIVFWSGI